MAVAPRPTRVFKTAWFTKAARKAVISANIDPAELSAFRELANGYERQTTVQLTALLASKELEEICHGDPA